MRAFDLACSLPWAITEDALRHILEIAARERLDVALARELREERANQPAALGFQAGRPLDGTRSVRVRSGVAILEITGPIMRRADLFTEISGGTSVEGLTRDFAVAANSPDVDAIILSVDSPGGEVTGIHEFGELIYASRAQKPVWAYVEGLGASAAYWLSSAAAEVITNPTGALGSIGAVMTVRDPSKTKAADIEIVSSQSPNKRPNPTTEAGRTQLQTMVDDLADVFVGVVARNRGVSAEEVLERFGQGSMAVGERAVAAGLADRVGTFEDTLAELVAAAAEQRRTSTQARHAAAARTQEESMTLREMFAAMFSGAKDAGIVASEEAAPAAEPVAEPTPAPAAEPVQEPVAEPASEQEPAKEQEPASEPAEPASEPNALAASQAAVVAASERASAAAAELARAQARIAELESSNRTSRLTALAQGWYGATADHLVVLEALDEGSPAFVAYTRTQNAAAEAIKQGGLFDSKGSDAPAPAAGGAWAQIERKADALRTEKPGMTKEQAIAAVLSNDKALYAAYRAEQAPQAED